MALRQRALTNQAAKIAPGLTQDQMEVAFRAICRTITEKLHQGEEVHLLGIGSLRVSWVHDRKWGGSTDGEVVPALRFRPFSSAKDAARAAAVRKQA